MNEIIPISIDVLKAASKTSPRIILKQIFKIINILNPLHTKIPSNRYLPNSCFCGQIYSKENFGSPRKKDIIMNFFGCTFRWNLADQCVKHPSVFNALLVFFLSLNIWEISSVWILSYWTKASSVLLSAETFWALLEWWWEKGIRSAWSIKTLESYHLPPPGGWRVRFLFQGMTNFCLY